MTTGYPSRALEFRSEGRRQDPPWTSPAAAGAEEQEPRRLEMSRYSVAGNLDIETSGMADEAPKVDIGVA